MLRQLNSLVSSINPSTSNDNNNRLEISRSQSLDRGRSPNRNRPMNRSRSLSPIRNRSVSPNANKNNRSRSRSRSPKPNKNRRQNRAQSPSTNLNRGIKNPYFRKISDRELYYDYDPHSLTVRMKKGKFIGNKLPNKVCRHLTSHCAKRFPTKRDAVPRHTVIEVDPF